MLSLKCFADSVDRTAFDDGKNLSANSPMRTSLALPGGLQCMLPLVRYCLDPLPLHIPLNPCVRRRQQKVELFLRASLAWTQLQPLWPLFDDRMWILHAHVEVLFDLLELKALHVSEARQHEDPV